MDKITSLLNPGEEAVQVAWAPHYYVTDHGRVISTQVSVRHKEPYIKATPPDGPYYHAVGLRVNGRDLKTNVHRLVAEAFLPDWNNELMVCHRDEELPPHLIDRPSNLFMGTHSDNMRDAVAKGRRQGFIVDDDELWETFISMGRDATAEWYGITRLTLQRRLDSMGASWRDPAHRRRRPCDS